MLRFEFSGITTEVPLEHARDKRIQSERGFSLVELMTVAAIIGVLATLAIPMMQAFAFRAKQSEAKTNLPSLMALVQTYIDTNDWPVSDRLTQGQYQAITADAWDPCTTPTSDGCNCQNPFGFSIGACAKARYKYWFAHHVSPHQTLLYAISNSVFCGDIAAGTADRWWLLTKNDDPTPQPLCNYYPGDKLGATCTGSPDWAAASTIQAAECPGQ